MRIVSRQVLENRQTVRLHAPWPGPRVGASRRACCPPGGQTAGPWPCSCTCSGAPTTPKTQSWDRANKHVASSATAGALQHPGLNERTTRASPPIKADVAPAKPDRASPVLAEMPSSIINMLPGSPFTVSPGASVCSRMVDCRASLSFMGHTQQGGEKGVRTLEITGYRSPVIW